MIAISLHLIVILVIWKTSHSQDQLQHNLSNHNNAYNVEING